MKWNYYYYIPDSRSLHYYWGMKESEFEEM